MPGFGNVTSVVLAVGLCLLSLPAYAQKVNANPRGETTASPQDYAVGFGRKSRLPANYDYYYYRTRYKAPQVIPTPVARQVNLNRVIGYVQPYDDVEYGKLVKEQIDYDSISTPGARERNNQNASDADAEGKSEPGPMGTTGLASPETSGSLVALHRAYVARVLDRGIIETSSGESMRLRGLVFQSLNSKDPSRAQFGRESVNELDRVLRGKKIYFTLGTPERGPDGVPLAIIHTWDGTEVNRLFLESGLAMINPGDFSDEALAEELIQAEMQARKNRRGIWQLW